MEIDLPGFSGFYESVYSHIVDDFIESDIEDGILTDDDSVDYKTTYENIAKLYAEKFIEVNEDILNDAGVTLKYKKVFSPREYNYFTDTIVCDAQFDKDKFIEYVKKNIDHDKLKDYAHDKFTSRSGFISFYSNNPKVWMEEYLYKIDEDNIVFQVFLHLLTFENDWAVEEEVLSNIYECIKYECGE